jgi:hypothetical protein
MVRKKICTLFFPKIFAEVFVRIFSKFLLFIFLSSILFACGFQVIYREPDISNKSAYEEELASIRIQKDSGRLTQELRNAVKDALNPDYIESDPRYVLSMSLTKGVAGTFITSTGASGRNKVILTIEYRLYDAINGRLLSTGVTTVNDNYDVQTNRYGTYVAEEYVRSNLVKVAALNIRNLLVNDLIEIKKASDPDEVLVNGVYDDEKTKAKQAKLAAQTSCVEAQFDTPLSLEQQYEKSKEVSPAFQTGFPVTPGQQGQTNNSTATPTR